jgi:hypothetical protein
VTDTLDQGTEGQQGNDGGENANIRHLRERAEAATAAEQRAAAAERKLAIVESGIDVSNPMAAFFVEHYDGDITDTAALVARAKEMGIPVKGDTGDGGAEGGQGAQQQGEGQQQGQEQGNHNQGGQRQVLEPTGTEQRRALAGEDPNLGEVNPNPRKVALEEAEQAIADGATFEQAGGHLVASLAAAAHRGDRRVIVEERRDDQGRVRQSWQ